jgi:shikimate kinase
MARKNNHLIYLTGFMGSGKSTIGPILANTLGYSFFDIDAEIEKATGKRIPEIFAESGERYFREVERQLLLTVSENKETVVSLGGGTIANDANVALIKSTGILVYLKADIEQIVKRLRNKTNRPVITDDEGRILPEDKLRERVRTIFSNREPYYDQSDIVVLTDDRRVGMTVDEIVRRIMRFSIE